MANSQPLHDETLADDAPATEKAAADRARESAKAPEVKAKQDNFLSREITRINNEARFYRRAAMDVMPAAIVNNSARFMALLQIISEVCMLRASASRAKQPWVSDTSKWTNFITQPPVRMWKDLTGNLMPVDLDTKKLFSLSGPGYALKRLVDTDAATTRELNELDNIRAKDPTAQLSLPNRWQARSTLMGLLAWGLNFILPEKPETDEQIDKMTELSKRNPVGYVLERLRQAVWFPEWTSHKRQMTGLGVMMSGICSMSGSLRNRAEMAPGFYKYKFNAGYFMTGAATFLSSLPLLFAVDNEKGYSGYGILHLLRVPFLFPSIATKFERKEPGVGWYTAGATGFQIQNFTGAMIGGGHKEKQPDGSWVVVDQKAKRDEAVLKYREKKKIADEKGIKVKDVPDDAVSDAAVPPQTKVSSIKDRDAAMPERRLAVMESGIATPAA